MSAPLLSRFDIVFILLDNPVAGQDEFLSEHILSLHSHGGGGPANAGAAVRRRMMRKRKATAAASQSRESQGGDGNGLRERLERAATENRDPIPAQLLRKYIAYARKCVSTVATTHAATKSGAAGGAVASHRDACAGTCRLAALACNDFVACC